MFSLFKRKKVSINSVSIPDFGWTKIKDDKSIIQWVNPEQSITIGIYFFDMPPDVPTVTNIEVLRKSFRNAISEVNGGLIEVVLLQKDKMPFIKTIFKIPQEPSGMTYNASLTIPFKTCSFVIKIFAIEVGITGMRDGMVADKLMAMNMMPSDENGFFDWFADPYDKDFKGGILMNKSENHIYDIEYPNHPLTQARQLIKQIEDDFQFKPEIKSLSAFDR